VLGVPVALFGTVCSSRGENAWLLMGDGDGGVSGRRRVEMARRVLPK
jgi:hypothetical protein